MLSLFQIKNVLIHKLIFFIIWALFANIVIFSEFSLTNKIILYYYVVIPCIYICVYTNLDLIVYYISFFEKLVIQFRNYSLLQKNYKNYIRKIKKKKDEEIS